jgi:hypothetical protein
MPRVWTRERLRHLAALAWDKAGDSRGQRGQALTHQQRMVLASGIFTSECPNHGIGRVSRFIGRWGPRISSGGSAADAPGRGCKSKLTPELCKEAAKILIDGWLDGDGHHQPFIDVDDALNRSARLKSIRQAAGLAPGTLWRRCKEVEREVSRKMMHFKPALSRAQRRERVAACRRLLKMADLSDYLKRTFWIDSKKMYMKPTPSKVIWPKSKRAPLAEHRLASFKKQDQVVVHYYAVVNYFVGPVLYVEVTGTTGLKTKYKVRVKHIYSATGVCGVYRGEKSPTKHAWRA